MLNNLLKYNHSLIWIFIIAVVSKLLMFHYNIISSSNYDASLFRYAPTNTIWSGLLTVPISIILGVLILFKNYKYNKQTRFSYWLVLIFVLLLNTYGHYGLSAEYICIFIFFICQYFLTKELTKKNDSPHVQNNFNLFLALSIGAMFSPHLVFYIPYFLIAILSTGMARFKGLIICILGFLLPFILVDSYIYIFMDGSIQYTHLYLLEQLEINKFHFENISSKWNNFYNILLFILLIYSIYKTFSTSDSNKIISRRFNTTNVSLVIYSIIIYLLGLVPIQLMSTIIILPTSYFYSNYINNSKQIGRSIFLGILIISIIISYPTVIDSIVTLIKSFF